MVGLPVLLRFCFSSRAFALYLHAISVYHEELHEEYDLIGSYAGGQSCDNEY